MLNLSLASLSLSESDKSLHAPVVISPYGANAVRSTTLELTLKHSTNDVDICCLVDVDDMVLSLVFDCQAVGILGIVCIAGICCGECDDRSTIDTKSVGIDCATVDDGLDKGQVCADRQPSKDDLADFSTCEMVS